MGDRVGVGVGVGVRVGVRVRVGLRGGLRVGVGVRGLGPGLERVRARVTSAASGCHCWSTRIGPPGSWWAVSGEDEG